LGWDWVGLGWVGLGWVGLGWVGLGRCGVPHLHSSQELYIPSASQSDIRKVLRGLDVGLGDVVRCVPRQPMREQILTAIFRSCVQACHLRPLCGGSWLCSRTHTFSCKHRIGHTPTPATAADTDLARGISAFTCATTSTATTATTATLPPPPLHPPPSLSLPSHPRHCYAYITGHHQQHLHFLQPLLPVTTSCNQGFGVCASVWWEAKDL
jgi:hypothetical protein